MQRHMTVDWQETRDRRWGYPCSQAGQPVLRMCKCAGIRSIWDALGLLSCFPSATFLEMVSHLQAHCRYGSTLHAFAGKQLKLSQDVLNHLLDVCIFIYQMNIVHEGWNLLPLWNRAQPPGLFEPCHLRKLSGGSGKIQMPSAPLLRRRSLLHCGPQQPDAWHSFCFFNETSQRTIMALLCLPLWLG